MGLNKSRKMSGFESRLSATTEEDLLKEIREFTTKSFNINEKKNEIETKELFEMKYQLFKLLQFYEFYRIKGAQENNKISLDKFARVFTSYINIYKNKEIYDKLNNDQLKFNGDITFNEFMCFHWFLSEISQVKTSIKEKAMNKNELIDVANKIIETLPDKNRRSKLSDKHISVLFDILDTDSKSKTFIFIF